MREQKDKLLKDKRMGGQNLGEGSETSGGRGMGINQAQTKTGLVSGQQFVEPELPMAHSAMQHSIYWGLPMY